MAFGKYQPRDTPTTSHDALTIIQVECGSHLHHPRANAYPRSSSFREFTAEEIKIISDLLTPELRKSLKILKVPSRGPDEDAYRLTVDGKALEALQRAEIEVSRGRER